MPEQIAGLFLYLCGAGLIIHNKTFVRRSLDFMPRARGDEQAAILFNRGLCVIAGLVTLCVGLLMILYPTPR
jgi:uncharacterized membrane protein